MTTGKVSFEILSLIPYRTSSFRKTQAGNNILQTLTAILV